MLSRINWKKIIVISLLFVTCVFFVGTQPTDVQALGGAGSAYTVGTTGPAPAASPNDDCGITNITACAEKAFNLVAATLAWTTLQFLGLILAVSGFVLDKTITYTVVEMSTNIGGITGIDVAWTVLRDIANMAFIFILLYAAILTILRSTSFNTKQVIINVIIVGLLINFSLFFTKVVIDVSNILAINFYQTTLSVCDDGTISSCFMQALNLETLFKDALTEDDVFFKIVAVGLGGSVLTLVGIFVFISSAILFLVRYGVLIFLMILSPLAFIGYILPQTASHTNKWWNSLIGQAVFAPIYLILIYVVILIINNDTFASLKGSQTFSTVLGNAQETLKNTTGPDNVGIFINFFIVIIFLIASLVIAKQFSSMSGSAVSGVSGKLNKYIGGGLAKNLGGRTARALVGASSEWATNKYDSGAARVRRSLETKDTDGRLARIAKATGRAAGKTTNVVTLGAAGAALRGTRSTLESGQKAKFGTGRSYDDVQKANKSHKQTVDSKMREQKVKAEIAQAKREITEAQTAPEREAAEEKLAKIVGQLSTNELVKNHKQDLKDRTFAKHLSKKQLDALEKNEEVNESLLEEIKGAKFADLGDAIKTGDNTGMQAALSKMDDSDHEALADSNLGYLTDDRLIDNMSVKDHARITDNKNIKGSVKGTVKDKFAESVGRNPSKIDNRKPKDLAKIKSTALVKDAVMNKFNVGDLVALADADLDDTTRRTIYQHLVTNRPVTDPVIIYLDNNPAIEAIWNV